MNIIKIVNVISIWFFYGILHKPFSMIPPLHRICPWSSKSVHVHVFVKHQLWEGNSIQKMEIYSLYLHSIPFKPMKSCVDVIGKFFKIKFEGIMVFKYNQTAPNIIFSNIGCCYRIFTMNSTENVFRCSFFRIAEITAFF